MQKRGWHTRGYLPHFDGNVVQFITFHLADSLPQPVLKKLEGEKEHGKLERYYDHSFIENVDGYLDTGIGECTLRNPGVAAIVEDALKYYDGIRYELICWVIMPNHTHFLIRPYPEWALSSIVKDLKGFTARQVNKLLSRSGSLWHPDYFDRFMRDREHLLRTIRCIEDNPVKAGLCSSPEDWRFSSAFQSTSE